MATNHPNPEGSRPSAKPREKTRSHQTSYLKWHTDNGEKNLEQSNKVKHFESLASFPMLSDIRCNRYCRSNEMRCSKSLYTGNHQCQAISSRRRHKTSSIWRFASVTRRWDAWILVFGKMKLQGIRTKSHVSRSSRPEDPKKLRFNRRHIIMSSTSRKQDSGDKKKYLITKLYFPS